MTTSEKRFGLDDSQKGVEGKDLNCEEEEINLQHNICVLLSEVSVQFLRPQGVTELLTDDLSCLCLSLF